jgi:hypothetical protein
MFYAGIGSRRTPEDALILAQQAAEFLADRGWTLRTGHAPGADQAFERGAGRKAEVYLPWPSFEKGELLDADAIIDHPSQAAFNIAAAHHPHWGSLGRGGRALHARNVHQILGRECNDPVRFVLCWTPNGEEVGGTAQAMRIAKAYGVEIINLATERERVLNGIGSFYASDFPASRQDPGDGGSGADHAANAQDVIEQPGAAEDVGEHVSG